MTAVIHPAILVAPAEVCTWLTDGDEIVFPDARKEGQHGTGHCLPAVDLPCFRLQTDIAILLPRLTVRCVLADDRDGAASISVDPHDVCRERHPGVALWSTRARLDRLPPAVVNAGRSLRSAEATMAGGLVALDLTALTTGPVALLGAINQALRQDGISMMATPDTLANSERIDTLCWNHGRYESNFSSMRAVPRWDTELPTRIMADGTAGFRIFEST